MFRRLIVLASTVLITAVLAGCGNTDTWVEAHPATGWPAQYADARNSSYEPAAGADGLRLEWTRSVKGQLASSVVLGSGSYLAVNAQTSAGCSLMVWETDNRARQRWCTRMVQGMVWETDNRARQRWCTRMVQGPGTEGPLSSPLFDGFDNLYVGQPGALVSFPPTQWIRWREPVIGMPTTPRFVAPGRLLVVTHLGQVLLFDAQKGVVDGSPLDLVAGVDPRDSERGLADCKPAKARCPVEAAPAFADQTGIVVLGLWEPDTDAPVLVGLRYRSGQNPVLTREWSSDAVGGGPLASPVLSADGSTVYVNGRDERLWAIDTDNGAPKWSVALNYLAQTPPSVSPDGLIVAGGGPGAKLMGIKDSGDRGEVEWMRDDVVPLTTSSQSGGHVAYTVARDGQDGQALVVFDPADGRTLNRYPLPNAGGWPVGVSIGHDRRVVTATSEGRVYGFAPA